MYFFFFRIFILHSIPSCNSFLAVVIMSNKAYIGQAFQNWRCILNMTLDITRVSACCPTCCIIYYHSPFIKCLLEYKICLSAQPSVCLPHPKHRTKLNSFVCTSQLWFIQCVLLKWENKEPFKKGLRKEANPLHKQEGESEMLSQLLVFNSATGIASCSALWHPSAGKAD